MFIIVALLIMMSIYIMKNDKMSDKAKTGWFIFLGVVALITIVGVFLF